MIAKTFEVRDRGAFIPVLAVALDPGCEADRYLIARAGFCNDALDQAEYVVVTRLADMLSEYDPECWVGSRTMQVAHRHIIKNFDDLESGAVIDVEYILGETDRPKTSEAEAIP